jgi:hypothetical protein
MTAERAKVEVTDPFEPGQRQQLKVQTWKVLRQARAGGTRQLGARSAVAE